MRYIGIVEDLTARGTLIARVYTVPPIGAEVVDRRKTLIGTVTRILGPVKAPYISIAPHPASRSKLLRIIGEDIYIP